MLFLDSLLLVLAALLPIANPLSTAPIFVTLSAGMTPAEQRKLARDASIYMAVVLLVVLVAGIGIMELFGISLGGIQVAGGLVILRIGFPMLFPAPEQSEVRNQGRQQSNPAFVPLAVPMMSGPGSMAVVLTITSRIQEEKLFRHEIFDYLAAAFGIIACSDHLLARSPGVDQSCRTHRAHRHRCGQPDHGLYLDLHRRRVLPARHRSISNRGQSCLTRIIFQAPARRTPRLSVARG
jgi:multiple antibiotic resistance protein